MRDVQGRAGQGRAGQGRAGYPPVKVPASHRDVQTWLMVLSSVTRSSVSSLRVDAE